MAASDAVKVLVDGLTFGGTVYAKGQVIFEPDEAILDCADEKRLSGDGELLCKRLSKADALKAAKAEEDEDVETPEPLVDIPVPDDDAVLEDNE